MIHEEEVFRIGRLGKTHGVRGEVSFLFEDDVWDRVEADYLVLRIDGIFVPFFLEEFRFKSDTNAIVKFEGIDSQERARELTGSDVYFPRALTDYDDDELSWTELVGFMLVNDATGEAIAKIASIDDTTLNMLFELEDGRLIPASEELITNIDKDKKTIIVNLPDGILDL